MDYDADWGYYDDSSVWDDYESPTEETGVTSDPYGGLSDYYAEKFGPDWESQFTPDQLTELKRLSTMTDEEFDNLTTDDESQTGGFWNDLGNLLTGAAGTLAGNAITNATTAGTAYLKKITPTTTTTTPATNTTDRNVLLGLAVAGLIAYLILKNR